MEGGKLVALYERPTPKRWRVPDEVLASLQPRRVEEQRVVVVPEPALKLSTRIAAAAAIVACVLVIVALLLVTGVIGSSGSTKPHHAAKPARVTKHVPTPTN